MNKETVMFALLEVAMDLLVSSKILLKWWLFLSGKGRVFVFIFLKNFSAARAPRQSTAASCSPQPSPWSHCPQAPRSSRAPCSRALSQECWHHLQSQNLEDWGKRMTSLRPACATQILSGAPRLEMYSVVPCWPACRRPWVWSQHGHQSKQNAPVPFSCVGKHFSLEECPWETTIVRILCVMHVIYAYMCVCMCVQMFICVEAENRLWAPPFLVEAESHWKPESTSMAIWLAS